MPSSHVLRFIAAFQDDGPPPLEVKAGGSFGGTGSGAGSRRESSKGASSANGAASAEAAAAAAAKPLAPRISIVTDFYEGRDVREYTTLSSRDTALKRREGDRHAHFE